MTTAKVTLVLDSATADGTLFARGSARIFPHVPISGSNWWVDIEVSGAAVASSLLMASII